MPSWWRLPFALVLLFTVALLVVLPVAVYPASAGPQVSGISTNTVDLGEDLDDSFDVMLVAADAGGVLTSRPLPVSTELARSGPARSLYRPPDRAPPAGHAGHQIGHSAFSGSAATAPPPPPPFEIASLNQVVVGDVSPLRSPAHPVRLRDHSRSNRSPLTTHLENDTWPR